MNIKTGKKMKGWMCHSPASTAVCISHDYRRAVILPRRPRDTTLVDHVRLLNRTNYVRLGDQRAIPSLVRRSSFPVSSLKNNQEKVPQETSAAAATSPPISDDIFQVVVMRVSIHCHGCAGKVKKHLSKMEGVTSFSIDLESKRVTVMGHVSPSGVLESISKVKKAEFWPC